MSTSTPLPMLQLNCNRIQSPAVTEKIGSEELILEVRAKRDAANIPLGTYCEMPRLRRFNSVEPQLEARQQRHKYPVLDPDATKSAGLELFMTRELPVLSAGRTTLRNPATPHHSTRDGEASEGTTSRAVAVCPYPDCGTTTPKGYLAKEAQAGRMGHQLYGVIYRDSWTEKTKARKRQETTHDLSEDSSEVTPLTGIIRAIHRERARPTEISVEG